MRPVAIGRFELHRQGGPLARFDNLAQSLVRSTHAVPAGKDQLIYIDPVARSVVLHLPVLRKRLSAVERTFGFREAPDQAQVVTTDRQ